MIFREFYLNGASVGCGAPVYGVEEYTVKIVRELLDLFHIKIIPDAEDADFAKVFVTNESANDGGAVSVSTRVDMEECGGERLSLCRTGTARADEREGAAVHRLIKFNLYVLFREKFFFPAAPWGILHGVRPTKIVHRLFGLGLSADDVIGRLKDDYGVSGEKAKLVTAVAVRQLPFIKNCDEKTIGVYVGIPFCITRCLYCSFPSNVLPNEKKLEEFMAAFQKDVASAKESIAKHGLAVESIYVGGGTPTSLPNEFFARMMKLVTDAFKSENLAEFTVEAGRPDSITPEKIVCMKKSGVTRVSVNPQTMRQKTLDIIGRRHTPDDIERMTLAFRNSGGFHINMDVILGLPGETADDVKFTMKKIAALAPDSVTLHTLTLKRGSRLKMLLDENESVDLPSAEETRKMYREAMNATDAMGMSPYYLYRQGRMKGDLDNVGCAPNGKESFYNIKIISECQTIIGVGGAATTKVLDRRENRLKSAFNAKDLITYLGRIDYYTKKRAALIDEIYS